jgi:hypothetical protein
VRLEGGGWPALYMDGMDCVQTRARERHGHLICQMQPANQCAGGRRLNRDGDLPCPLLHTSDGRAPNVATGARADGNIRGRQRYEAPFRTRMPDCCNRGAQGWSVACVRGRGAATRRSSSLRAASAAANCGRGRCRRHGTAETLAGDSTPRGRHLDDCGSAVCWKPSCATACASLSKPAAVVVTSSVHNSLMQPWEPLPSVSSRSLACNTSWTPGLLDSWAPGERWINIQCYTSIPAAAI